MTRETMLKIMEVQERAWQDSVTCELAQAHAQANRCFLQVMEDLTAEQRNTIFAYMGILFELQNQFLVYAVENP